MIPFFDSKTRRRKKLQRIKFIACDLDGTLLHDDNQLSPHTRDAIKKLSSIGVEIILFSGRSDGFIRSFTKQIGTNMPIVSLSGSLIKSPSGELLFGSFMNEDISSTICDISGKYSDLTLAAFTADGIVHETPTVMLPRYLRSVASEQKRIRSLAEYFGKTALYVVTGSFTAIQEIVRTIAKKYQDKLVRAYYQTAMGEDKYYLEIKLSGVNKGTALQFLSKYFSVKSIAFAAIGDFDNDIEMCRFAGVSAAMRNAVDPLKEVVDIVTRSTNNEDGAAEFFQLIIDAYNHSVRGISPR